MIRRMSPHPDRRPLNYMYRTPRLHHAMSMLDEDEEYEDDVLHKRFGTLCAARARSSSCPHPRLHGACLEPQIEAMASGHALQR